MLRGGRKRTGKPIAQRRLNLCTQCVGPPAVCAGALLYNALFVN
jgi:hypothetical protein